MQIPIGISGSYHVFVATDAENRVYEYTSKANNIRQSNTPCTVTLTPYADLEVSNVVAPTLVEAYKDTTISWTVSNRGNGITGDGTPGKTVYGWTDRIVVSHNMLYGDADDRVVAEISHMGALESGQSYTGTWTGKLHSGLSGDYYVFISTDVQAAVYEYKDTFSNIARAQEMIHVNKVIINPGTLQENTVWNGIITVQ